jgi:hypothetical protein
VCHLSASDAFKLWSSSEPRFEPEPFQKVSSCPRCSQNARAMLTGWATHGMGSERCEREQQGQPGAPPLSLFRFQFLSDRSQEKQTDEHTHVAQLRRAATTSNREEYCKRNTTGQLVCPPLSVSFLFSFKSVTQPGPPDYTEQPRVQALQLNCNNNNNNIVHKAQLR